MIQSGSLRPWMYWRFDWIKQYEFSLGQIKSLHVDLKHQWNIRRCRRCDLTICLLTFQYKKTKQKNSMFEEVLEDIILYKFIMSQHFYFIASTCPKRCQHWFNYIERTIVSSIRKIIALDHTFVVVSNSGSRMP